MSVITNNLVLTVCLLFRRNLNCFIFSVLRFLRNDKMTADFSVMIKNEHSKIIIINSLKAASKIELISLTKVMKSFIGWIIFVFY